MDLILDKIIDDFNQLKLEDREYLLEIMKKQLTENRRENLKKRADEALLNYKKGKVKRGSVKDLLKDLEND
jgi:hypothetical protein